MLTPSGHVLALHRAPAASMRHSGRPRIRGFCKRAAGRRRPREGQGGDGMGQLVRRPRFGGGNPSWRRCGGHGRGGARGRLEGLFAPKARFLGRFAHREDCFGVQCVPCTHLHSAVSETPCMNVHPCGCRTRAQTPSWSTLATCSCAPDNPICRSAGRTVCPFRAASTPVSNVLFPECWQS